MALSNLARRGMSRWLVACAALVASSVIGYAGTASAQLAAAPTPQPPSCARADSIIVRPAGGPIADQRAIQKGISKGQASGKCVRLEGQFNVGRCLFCLEITAPVTVVGQADPTGPNPEPRKLTVITAEGGIGILSVDVEKNPKKGNVRISDLWLRGAGLIALPVVNWTNGTLEISRNRITNVFERFGFRFGIGGSTTILPASLKLEGDVVIRDNYVNTTAIEFVDLPFILGDDNAIAFQNGRFDTLQIVNNTAISNGESLEMEAGICDDVVVANNIVETRRATPSLLALIVDTPAFPDLHGGHPASIKFAGNDFGNLDIHDNYITTGTSNNNICIMQYQVEDSVHDSRTTTITGNTCDMDGIFAGLLGGWAGELPFFAQGTMNDATVEDNTFIGTAFFGITLMDFVVPLLPENDLVNTSHGNTLRNNDFSDFVAGEASVYFGPSTFDNLFIGDPNGPVIDEGDNEVIVP